MPIRTENKAKYPADWKQIRAAILQRAQNRCEWCGVGNHAEGFRTEEGRFVEGQEWESHFWGYRHIRIVLTIAHLDHNPENNDRGNLAALCQKCHNGYDAKQRAKGRKERATINSGQLPLKGCLPII